MANGGTLYRPPTRRRLSNSQLVVVLLVLAGAGYAAWEYREDLVTLYHRHLGPAQIVVKVVTYPADAKLFLDGVLVPDRALKLDRSGSRFRLRVQAQGFRSKTIRFTADRSQEIKVVLRRGRKAPAPRPKGPRRVASSKRCPPGMQRIPEGAGAEDEFCIDRHEHPGRGKTPRYGVSLAQARAACHARGTRLCTVKEWVRACGGRRFPYGATYRPGRCNTGGEAPLPAGSRRGCRSRWGIYDMSGNVSEWVDDGVAMGGDARLEKGATGCRASSDRGGPLAGIRCCADPAWE